MPYLNRAIAREALGVKAGSSGDSDGANALFIKALQVYPCPTNPLDANHFTVEKIICNLYSHNVITAIVLMEQSLPNSRANIWKLPFDRSESHIRLIL